MKAEVEVSVKVDDDYEKTALGEIMKGIGWVLGTLDISDRYPLMDERELLPF